MTPAMYLKMGVAVAAFAVAAFLVWTVLGWRSDANRLPVVEKEFSDYRAEAEKNDLLLAKRETELQESYKIIREKEMEWDELVSKNASMRACAMPDDGVQLINKAAAAGRRTK